MKNKVRVRALSCPGTFARGLSHMVGTETFASRVRVRFTTRLISVLLLSLVCVVSARAQGSPDVVWQGQHTGFLRYTVFSPDGQLLISGGDDRTNEVWQAANGTPVRTIVQCGGVGCAGSTFGFVSPDGQTLLTSGLRFWRISDGTLQRRLGIGGNLALSPDWQYIVSSSFSSSYPGNETRTTTLFRVSDGALVRTMPGVGVVTSAAFTPDGQTLITSSWETNGDQPASGYGTSNGSLRFWRVSDGALLKTYEQTTGLFANAVTVSPDGMFFSYTYDSTV